jgi:hypothetical protein
MSATTVAAAFADAASALVGEPDVADILAHLVADCAEVMNADAVAILARDAIGELSLLVASSHRATELELLQIQRSVGPCVDVIDSDEALCVTGAAELEKRWQHVGTAITDAGFDAVEAYPMRWRGTVLGGLNVFRSRGSEGPDAATGQAFADIATLAVIYSMPISAEQAATRLHEALNARELVEQAKGVIAYVDDVDMSAAYDTLLRRAEDSGQSLTRAAAAVVGEQHRQRSP